MNTIDHYSYHLSCSISHSLGALSRIQLEFWSKLPLTHSIFRQCRILRAESGGKFVYVHHVQQNLY